MAFTGIPSQLAVGTPTVAKINDKGILSSIVATQFPQFIQQDHQKFIRFIEAYYEWLETTGQLLYGQNTLRSNRDIDTTVDSYLEYFRKEFLVNISSQIKSPKDLVLKNIRDYYRARGSERSFQFFLRIFLGQEATFYYPRIDMLRCSDGKWILPKTMRVEADTGDPFELVGKKVTGTLHGSSASVEKVLFVEGNSYYIYELFLNTTSITGLFTPAEVVVCDEIGFSGRVDFSLGTIKITEKGKGYQTDQVITIGGSGQSATAKITSVNTTGGIVNTVITNPGVRYGTANVTFPVYPGVTLQATGTIDPIGVISYPGYYLNEDGQLSTTKFLQDSNYYQQFSYVVQVEEAVNTYREALKKALHPAGLKFFGSVLSINPIDASVGVATRIVGEAHTIVDRELQDFNQVVASGQGVIDDNAKIKGVDHELKFSHQFYSSLGTFKLGPSLRSIERDKFQYRPSTVFDATTDFTSGPNVGYWGGSYNLGNYHIDSFKNILVGDMILRPYLKTNILPETIMYIKPYDPITENFSGVAAYFNPNFPSSTTVTSTNQITQLNDVTGYTRHGTQSTTANKPQLTRTDNKGNLAIQSRTFANASWTKVNCAATDNFIANYDSTTTAAKIVASAGNTVHGCQQSSNITSFTNAALVSGTYSASFWLKRSNYDYIWVGEGGDGPWHGCNVNVNTGTIQNTTGLSSSSITSLGSGWYRVDISWTRTSAGQIISYVYLSQTGLTTGGVAWNAGGTEEVYCGGISMRYSAWDSTEIVTTTSQQWAGIHGQKTVIFDGSNDCFDCTTYFPQIDGGFSIAAVVSCAVIAPTQQILTCRDANTGVARFQCFQTAGAVYFGAYKDSGTYIRRLTSTSALVVNTPTILIMTYDGGLLASGVKIYVNGTQADITTETSGSYTVPAGVSAKTLEIGAQTAGTNGFWQGVIAAAATYHRALTTAEVANITLGWKTKYGIP